MYNKKVVFIWVFAINSSFFLYNFSHIYFKFFFIVVTTTVHGHFMANTRSSKLKSILVTYFNRAII
ncbi:hypothetical protein D3C85_983740 [compost metagenome]